MSRDIERNLKLIELGYKAKSQGIDLDILKESIVQLHHSH